MQSKKQIRKPNDKRMLSAILIFMAMAVITGCDTDDNGSDEITASAQITVNETIKEGETPTIIVKPVEGQSEELNQGEPAGNDASIETAEIPNEESAASSDADADAKQEAPSASPVLQNGQPVSLDPSWQYASYSKINSGAAVFYAATENRLGITVGVNAGHGTSGGGSVKTYCHPDMTPKVTGGTTAAGETEATAVSGGMSFNNGEKEADVNLRLARFIRDELLKRGYDVLMIRDGDDVQLDNVARTVICNNMADCHIAIHFDGDGTGSDKGCFYISVPDGIKYMEPVDRTWQMSEELGSRIVTALSNHGHKLHNGGSMDIDLTQTSYSSIPSVDVEYGNQCSDTSDANLMDMAVATADGVDGFFTVSN